MNKFLTVSDGTKIAYDVHGEPDKPSMLMIHGVTDSKETYDTDLEALTKYFQVYRYDLRGHGHSDHPKNQYDLTDHIQDALDLIKALGLHNFVLYGGSLGSYIAQGVAVKISDNISKLILNVSASHNPASALAETSKEDAIPTDPTLRRQYWIKHLLHDPNNFDKLNDSGFQKYSLNPEDEYRALKSITRFDFRDRLGKINCPVLVTSGIFDPVNPANSKGAVFQQYLKNSKFLAFPSGHLMRLEIPEEYHRALLDFLV